MNDAAFFNLVLAETGCGMLLDVHNLHVNAQNHDYDPYGFLDALPAGAVKSVHTAGGGVMEGVLTDTHNNVMPEETLDLLEHALKRQRPATIIVERDDGLHELDQITGDVERVRARLAGLGLGRVSD